MLGLIKKYFENDKEVMDKIEHLSNLKDQNKGLVPKIVYFFAVFFMFSFFMSSSIVTIGLVGISVLGENSEKESIFFIVSAILTAISAYVFFRLMRKFIKKLKQPIKKEVKLKM